MAEKNKTTLKALFETGDSATEAGFTDIIDSNLNVAEVSSQSVTGPVSFGAAIAVTDVSGPSISTSGAAHAIVSASALHVAGHILTTSAATLNVDTTAVAVAGAGAGAGAVPSSAAFMKLTVNGTEYKLALYS